MPFGTPWQPLNGLIAEATTLTDSSVVNATVDHSGHHVNYALLTFGAALILGVFFIILAKRLGVSAIVVLLLGGILVGPSALQIINPEYIGEAGMQTIIALAVGIILFEGGLSLEPEGYRQASRAIKGILTIGVVVTWLGTAGLIKLFLPGFEWSFVLLAASLVIVTGPTVIGPLLKRIHVTTRIHHILHWEGVLIDPIGVLIALLCFNFYKVSHLTLVDVLVELGQRVGYGFLIGILGGFILTEVIKRKWIPSESLNIFVLASAVGLFTLSEYFSPESGLLSVTLAGFAVGYRNLPEMKKLREYKAELTELLIGLLFVLLASTLKLESFLKLGWQGLCVVLAVMFVIRPLNIFLSTMGSGLPTKDKLFLSWIAPRGIVAASLASLCGLTLMEKGYPSESNFLVSFTYSVIAGTVLFQGFTAGFVGKFLGVLEPKSTGWLIVGAHKIARTIGKFIQSHGEHVVHVDTNPRHVALAKQEGLKAICDDVLTVDLEWEPELYGVGNILAITRFGGLNNLACVRFRDETGNYNLYKWREDMTTEARGDQEMIAGDRIWPVIQQTHMQAMDDEEHSNIDNVRLGVDEVQHPERVLFSYVGGELLPSLPMGEEDDVKRECHALVYLPFAVTLNLNIKPEWALYSKASTFEELLDEFLSKLTSSFKSLDTENIKKTLMDKENEYSSLVGYDVALPHCYIDDIDTSVVMIAKLHLPLKDQHSGDDVRYVFLVLSPADQPKDHLSALSEISKFIMEEQNRNRLKNVDDEFELLNVFFTER